jgi:hypothetical protein
MRCREFKAALMQAAGGLLLFIICSANAAKMNGREAEYEMST